MNRLQKISMLSLSLLLGGIPMKAVDNVVNNVRLGAVRGRVVDNAQQVLPGASIYWWDGSQRFLRSLLRCRQLHGCECRAAIARKGHFSCEEWTYYIILMPSLLAIIRFPNAVERSFDSNQAIDWWTSNDRLMPSGRSLKHYSSVITYIVMKPCLLYTL